MSEPNANLAHVYPFDPTCDYTLDQLLTIKPPDAPADFEPFWQATYAAARNVPLRIEVAGDTSREEGFIVRLVRFDGLGGVRLGGWLVEPADGVIDRYIVTGHGYYNRPIEDIHFQPRAANLFFSCRGLGISRSAGISDQTMFHVLHGIEDKASYVHRGCVADTWSAASALLELFPAAAGRLEYCGESFGGGIGAMALAWDRRFNFADLRVPSFGHHPIRLRCQCNGAGEAVRRKLHRAPELYDRTLRYFDAAVHAMRITIPIAFACATFDPAVPPPGQFAVYNAVPGDKVVTVWRTGHHAWAGTIQSIALATEDASGLRNRALPPIRKLLD